IVPGLNDPDGKLPNYTVFATNGTLTVTPAQLTVAANNATRTYGATNPVFSGSIVGLQNNDNITATFASSATAQSPVGNYPIVPTLSDPNGKLGNYAVLTNNGTLILNAAALTGTVDDKTRPYGQPNPVFTVHYSGFVNNENESVLSGVFVGATVA